MPPVPSVHPSDSQKDKPKKPRHRHSPTQLAALNELYEKDEHPPLELRTSLAKRLGMETKTVNAWFQNKRASSKKRTTTRPISSPYELPPITATYMSSSSSSSTTPPQQDEFEDDSFVFDADISRSWSSFYAGNPDHAHFLSESDSMPKRMRLRPTQEQTDELRNLYNINPHPTTEQRQVLAERIGMRYQSITNWFQNQRSVAKKKKEDEEATVAPGLSSAPESSRTFSAFPPPSNHPSIALEVPPRSTHPSLPPPPLPPAQIPMRHRSPSVSSSPPDDLYPLRRSNPPRRSVTPYSTTSRPRRSRPEPYQLDALKDLFTKTPTPSIDERSVLAQEIGMDLGKVTNWFRNLRQTSRKRAKKEEDGSGDEYAHSRMSSLSRSGTPSSPSSSLDGDIDMPHSDVASDDEYEAVTPSPASSPRPQTRKLENVVLALDPALYAEAQKATKNFKSGVQAEDALLLLSFHEHIIVH